MVSLIYHRKLDDAWTAAAQELRTVLAGAAGATATPHVIGRSRCVRGPGREGASAWTALWPVHRQQLGAAAAAAAGAGSPQAGAPPAAHPPTIAPAHKTNVLLPCSGQKVCLDADEVLEQLTVEGGLYLQQVQVEAAFSQPNGGMCQHMLGWARSATGACTARALPTHYPCAAAHCGSGPPGWRDPLRPARVRVAPLCAPAVLTCTHPPTPCACLLLHAEGSQGGDLLELYCGNGNFTQAVAPHFRKVRGGGAGMGGVGQYSTQQR